MTHTISFPFHHLPASRSAAITGESWQPGFLNGEDVPPGGLVVDVGEDVGEEVWVMKHLL